MNVASLWRYPVKSMMGEELNRCDITERGVYGDRAFGVIDIETGKLANAKNPAKWPEMFRYRASFIKPPQLYETLPPVRITFPNGQSIVSDSEELNRSLSDAFQRQVTLASPSMAEIVFEGLIPTNIEGLDNPGTVFSKESPEQTFFDIAMVHIITTSTIRKLQKMSPNSRIEPRRFRPNIIIDIPDAEGFVEEQWIDKTISIGDSVKLQITQPTKRCIMTTLAQGDLPDDSNVLRTLVKENAGNFGVYAEVIKGGTVLTGDSVRFL